MNGQFEFQFPWLLGLLAVLPVYALLHGKTGGPVGAELFSSADIARAWQVPKPGRYRDAFCFCCGCWRWQLSIVALAGRRRGEQPRRDRDARH